MQMQVMVCSELLKNTKCNLRGLSRKSHVEFPGQLLFGLGICKGCNIYLQNVQK